MNCNTQNAKIASITEKTLIVGIDVGSETHFARAFDWRNYEYTKKPLEFSNTEAGFMMFKAWVEDIAEKQGKTAVIPGMEPTGHYWFALGKFLQDSGMKPVHVNPHHVKKSKELDDNNPNKNDRKDREIPLPLFIVDVAKKFASNPKAYILTGTDRYIEPRTMQNRFKSYVKECNVEPANFHVLRHTFATRCVEVGFEVKSLSEVLGHANVNITLNRYVHSSFELKHSNMNKLASQYKPSNM